MPNITAPTFDLTPTSTQAISYTLTDEEWAHISPFYDATKRDGESLDDFCARMVVAAALCTRLGNITGSHNTAVGDALTAENMTIQADYAACAARLRA